MLLVWECNTMASSSKMKIVKSAVKACGKGGPGLTPSSFNLPGSSPSQNWGQYLTGKSVVNPPQKPFNQQLNSLGQPMMNPVKNAVGKPTQNQGSLDNAKTTKGFKNK